MIGSDRESVRLMTRAGVLYYRQGLTQHEVAQRLGVSRPTAGRLLARAVEAGIVKITIESSDERAVETEVALEERFGLVEAIVVESAGSDESTIRAALGRGCADLLTRRVTPGMVVGLGWSRTVQQIPAFLDPAEFRALDGELTVVQLDGAAPPASDQLHPILAVAAVASRLGARQILMPAPLYLTDESTAHGILKDKSVADSLAIAARADLCIFGIGDLSRDTTLFVTGEIDEPTLTRLADLGAVGDICGRFFDASGRAIRSDLAERTISLPLDTLATRPLRVAAVTGERRARAVLAALRGGLTNALITDTATARALLDAAADSEHP